MSPALACLLGAVVFLCVPDRLFGAGAWKISLAFACAGLIACAS